MNLKREHINNDIIDDLVSRNDNWKSIEEKFISLKNDLDNTANDLAGKANTRHTHNISDISSLSQELNSKVNQNTFTLRNVQVNADLKDIRDKLSRYRDENNNKADKKHTHQIKDIESLQSKLDDKLPEATFDRNKLKVDGKFEGLENTIDKMELAIGVLGEDVDTIVSNPLGTTVRLRSGLQISFSEVTVNLGTDTRQHFTMPHEFDFNKPVYASFMPGRDSLAGSGHQNVRDSMVNALVTSAVENNKWTFSTQAKTQDREENITLIAIGFTKK